MCVRLAAGASGRADSRYMLITQGAMAGHAYRSAVDELDNGVGRDLVRATSDMLLLAHLADPLTSFPAAQDVPYRATVLEPIGKLCSYYPTINEGIAKRNKKLLDYDSARAKVRKLAEKPSEDMSKLPRVRRRRGLEILRRRI